MGEDDLAALAADIKAYGLREPIKLDRDGRLVNGRNRLAARDLAGIVPRFKRLGPRVDLVAYIVSANLHRRHLTAEQKRDVIAALLRAKPERSDRETARIAQVSDKTVATVRADLEANAEIPHKPSRAEVSGRVARGRKPSGAPAPHKRMLTNRLRTIS
jgi:ParB-like chromosome segregation protein Spo0J